MIRVGTQVQENIGQQATQAAAPSFEIHVEVVDFHAGEFRSVPLARFFGMRIEEHATVRNDLLREDRGIGSIAQHHAGRDAEGHHPLTHLEPRDEKFSFVQPAPLDVEISATLDGVIAHADEIELGDV